MQQLRRIDFFKNDGGQCGVLNTFTQDLQQALQKIGIESRLIDPQTISHGELLALLTQDRPDCTAGFNTFVRKTSVIEPLGIPHLSLIVDSAPYYMEVREVPNIIAAFADEDSCQFIQLAGQKEVLFFPHAIDTRFFAPDHRKKVKEAKRDLECVMPCSYIEWEKEERAWQEWFSKKSYMLLREIAEEVLASPMRSHLEVFMRVIQAQNPIVGEMQEKGIPLPDLLNSLERYIRGVDRIRMVQALDIKVHIYGQTAARWKTLEKKNFVYHPPVPYHELPTLFLRAKTVFNSIPTIKCGYHERLFLALACGASVVGSENLFTKRDFPDQKAYLGLLSPHYNEVNKLLQEAFWDEEARLDAVLKTHPLIIRDHTWDVRAEKLTRELPAMLTRIYANWQPEFAKLFFENEEKK